MLRNLMLKLSENDGLVSLVGTVGMKAGVASRFVAGVDIDQAIQVVRDLNSKSILASLDLLGEGVTDKTEARKAAEAYTEHLEIIQRTGIRSNISIKLTQLGLDISKEVCASNLKPILDKARELGNFVRIDMEGSAYTEDTIELFREHFALYGNHVGIVIQSYLYRSAEDIRTLAPLACNVRLCKGAYMEPPEIAFPKKSDVDASYMELLEILLRSPSYTAIATHDDRMIDHARRFIAENRIPDDRYEFQMLYGVRRELQVKLREEGYKVRVYVPFGSQWAPYFMRRLAERPANVVFVLKNLFRR